ncbi:MAG: hypothetical protein AAFW46_14985 [Pseudomonadota bacterium]
MSIAIITGGDAQFFPLLEDLIDSLDAARPTGVEAPVYVFDFGLAPEQIEALAPRVARVFDPGWDLDFPFLDQTPGYKKYVTAAPFAPKHAPGHEVYVWIDADAWVQRWEAVETLVAGARRAGLSACQENDRHYPSALSGAKPRVLPVLGLARPTTYMAKRLRKFYGRRVAAESFFRPIVNAGVYAVASGAPHWAAWERSLRAARFRKPGDLSDQIALNHALITEGLPIEHPPAWCNWLCTLATPAYDPERDLLVEPMAPHHPIGIVHLVNKAKRETHRLRTLEGAEIAGGLTYRSRPRKG